MALNQQMLQHSSWHEGSEKYVAWNISIGTPEGKRSFIWSRLILKGNIKVDLEVNVMRMW